MRQRGFTLIEVVAVLLVLGVATAVVVPSVSRGTQAIRARAEVAGFSAFLRHAREVAVLRRLPIEVHVDPQGRTLALGPAGSPEVRAVRRLGPGVRVDAVPPGGLSVRFLPEGLSTGGAFRLATDDGRVYLITVDQLTGRVRNRREHA